MRADLGPPEGNRLGIMRPAVAEIFFGAIPLEWKHAQIDFEPRSDQVKVAGGEHRPIDQPLVHEPEPRPTPSPKIRILRLTDAEERTVELDCPTWLPSP